LVESTAERVDESTDKRAFRIKYSRIVEDLFINEHDHGIISALAVMHILKKDYLKHHIPDYLVQEACVSIALHSQSVYEKFNRLSFHEFPFGFLLVYCDTVQQWGRPKLSNLQESIRVQLKDISVKDQEKNKDGAVRVDLKYLDKLTEHQKNVIARSTHAPTKIWHTDKELRFLIDLFEGSSNDALYKYRFPYCRSNVHGTSSELA
jgi:hypothetical protein